MIYRVVIKSSHGPSNCHGFHVLNQVSNSAYGFVLQHCIGMIKATVYTYDKAWNFTSVLCILLGKKAKFKA